MQYTSEDFRQDVPTITEKKALRILRERYQEILVVISTGNKHGLKPRIIASCGLDDYTLHSDADGRYRTDDVLDALGY